MATKEIEGDWQFMSEKVNLETVAFNRILFCFVVQGYDPVKVSVKNIMGSDWIVACMIPKGNMMASMLKREEGGKFTLIKLNCSNRECPKENKELEDEFKIFLEKGISSLSRQGKGTMNGTSHNAMIQAILWW